MKTVATVFLTLTGLVVVGVILANQVPRAEKYSAAAKEVG